MLKESALKLKASFLSKEMQILKNKDEQSKFLESENEKLQAKTNDLNATIKFYRWTNR